MNVVNLREMTPEQRQMAGGKVGTLAKLLQAGYQVSPGFVILPQAFAGKGLTPADRVTIESQLTILRRDGAAVAVRSSAMSKDGAGSFFAGEFESYLNSSTDDAFWQAVASTTDVGWTPLFPRAAAVVTDVGAPLSHAAIVARELGIIPAVVGCGDATTRLCTGDRVRVDGGLGLVVTIA